MKFTVQKKYLLAAIQNVSHAISSRTVNPILTGMKIEVNHAAIILTGSNSDITIQSHIPTTIKKDTGKDTEEEIITDIVAGDIVLPVPHFPDIIKKLPEETVRVEVQENYKTVIQSGKAIFTLYGQSIDEYPHIQIKEHEEHIKLSGTDLRRLINQTAFAVSQMETRPILTGVQVQVKEKSITFTATDSHRLSTSTMNVETHRHEATEIVIPGKSLHELNKIIADRTETVHMVQLDNQVLFYAENVYFLSRLLTGNYPDTSRLIPTDSQTTLHIQTRDFIQTIERAALLSNKDQNNVIRLDTIGEGMIEITGNSPEIGNVKEQLKAISVEGESLKISFSSKYLLDTLKTMNEDHVKIDFTGAMRPFIITSPGNEQILQLILPVRTF